jgi:hypothetical protein
MSPNVEFRLPQNMNSFERKSTKNFFNHFQGAYFQKQNPIDFIELRIQKLLHAEKAGLRTQAFALPLLCQMHSSIQWVFEVIWHYKKGNMFRQKTCASRQTSQLEQSEVYL